MKTYKALIQLRAPDRVKPTTSQEMVTWFHYQHDIETNPDLTLEEEQAAWDRYLRHATRD